MLYLAGFTRHADDPIHRHASFLGETGATRQVRFLSGLTHSTVLAG